MVQVGFDFLCTGKTGNKYDYFYIFLILVYWVKTNTIIIDNYY